MVIVARLSNPDILEKLPKSIFQKEGNYIQVDIGIIIKFFTKWYLSVWIP